MSRGSALEQAKMCRVRFSGVQLQELGLYGKLRKVQNCGPVSMFRALLVEWKVGGFGAVCAQDDAAWLDLQAEHELAHSSQSMILPLSM